MQGRCSMLTFITCIILLQIDGVIFSLAILGLCYFYKLMIKEKTWTSFFDRIGYKGIVTLALFSIMIFSFISYYMNLVVFHFVKSNDAHILSISLVFILSILFLTQIKRGKEWFIHGEKIQKQETIYK